MKRIILILGGAFVVVVAGVFIVLATLDINQYKGLIQDQVAAATGRTLTIDGDLKLAISLNPAIQLNGVRFQNAEWGSRPDMAVIERIEASVPLIPLLSGRVEVTRLALVKPDILLERNADGRANWAFSSAETAADAEAEATALAISAIEVDDAVFSFNDAQANSKISAALERLRINITGDLLAPVIQKIDLENLAASMASDSGEDTSIVVAFLTVDATSSGADLSLESIAAGQNITADGTIGPLGRLVAMEGVFPAKLALSLGEFDFDTDLNVDLSAARPKISGSITSETLDLTKLPPTEDVASAKLFPSDPIPMDGLKAVDVDLDIQVARLILQKSLALTNLKTNIKLVDGRLEQSQTAEIAGGTLESDIQFTAPSGVVIISSNGTGISAERIAKDLEATDIITQGLLDYELSLNGRGLSVAALMASLDGSVIGGMGEARIRNDAINLAGADFISQLISNINPFMAQEDFTVAQCAVVNLQVQDGIARTDKGIAFVSDRIEVTSSGSINLADEKIDLNIRPKAKEGLGVGMGKLTQVVKISGSLSNPGIGFDAAGAVRSLGSIAGAFATGGASLLAEGALERGQSAGDTCQAARTWHLAGN